MRRRIALGAAMLLLPLRVAWSALVSAAPWFAVTALLRAVAVTGRSRPVSP